LFFFVEPASCLTLAEPELKILRQENTAFLKSVGQSVEKDIVKACSSHVEKIALGAELKSVDELSEQIQNIYQLIMKRMDAVSIYSSKFYAAFQCYMIMISLLFIYLFNYLFNIY
jgi:hypothetical protein